MTNEPAIRLCSRIVVNGREVESQIADDEIRVVRSLTTRAAVAVGIAIGRRLAVRLLPRCRECRQRTRP